MSYQSALEAAGAKVLAFEQFGSYQGEWLAKVESAGETFYVQGSYGSCSGLLMPFESEFGYGEGKCDEHSYSDAPDCPDCLVKKAEYQIRLAAFGMKYFDDRYTKEGHAETVWQPVGMGYGLGRSPALAGSKLVRKYYCGPAQILRQSSQEATP